MLAEQLGLQVLGRLPFFLIWTVAVVLAAIRWEKQPTVSALVITAGVLQVIAALGSMVLPTVLSHDGASRSVVFWLVSVGSSLLSATGLACLVGAAFAERRTRAEPPPR